MRVKHSFFVLVPSPKGYLCNLSKFWKFELPQSVPHWHQQQGWARASVLFLAGVASLKWGSQPSCALQHHPEGWDSALDGSRATQQIPDRSIFLTDPEQPQGWAVEGSWGGAGWCCCSSVSFLAFLGQQQSGGGHGEGREPACDQRGFLCILGE